MFPPGAKPLAKLLGKPLPAAVQKSHVASIIPSEISLPLKTTINSRMRTIWPMTAVNPISARTALAADGDCFARGIVTECIATATSSRLELSFGQKQRGRIGMPSTGSTILNRREALIKLLRLGGVAAGTAGLGLWLSERSQRPEPELALKLKRSHTVSADAALPEMAVIQGGDPEGLVRTALEELGGIRRFISRADVVLVKPNIGWDRTPEQAANTNPKVVAEIVRQCWNAGAKRVIVTDVSCNDPRRCFQRSGIAEASQHEGAEVILPDPGRFKSVDLQGELLRDWPVFDPFLNADKIINVPIAKHHSLTGTTLGMKNWYGILGGPRDQLHQNIHESLVDLADFIRPTLTLIDCYRVLIRNGPTGGNLDDVLLKKTLVAGTNPVALDAYVAKAYWNLEASSLPYLKMASQRGLGAYEFEKIRTRVRNSA